MVALPVARHCTRVKTTTHPFCPAWGSTRGNTRTPPLSLPPLPAEGQPGAEPAGVIVPPAPMLLPAVLVAAGPGTAVKPGPLAVRAGEVPGPPPVGAWTRAPAASRVPPWPAVPPPLPPPWAATDPSVHLIT